MIDNYRVLRGYLADLEHQVNMLIADGWEPIGGVCIVCDSGGERA